MCDRVMWLPLAAAILENKQVLLTYHNWNYYECSIILCKHSQLTVICTSWCQNGVRGSWIPTGRVWSTVALLAFAEPSDWPCKDNGEELGLHWQHTVSQLRLWWTANTGPSPLLPATWWALLPPPRIPNHRHRAGKCVCPKRQHIVWRTREKKYNYHRCQHQRTKKRDRADEKA